MSFPSRRRLRPRPGTRLLSVVWVVVVLTGALLLMIGLFGTAPVETDVLELPAGLRPVDLESPWLPQIGSVLVGTAYVWALAARTGGRPVVFSLLTATVGAVVLWADQDLMRNGAAVMVCVVSAVLAIVATVPAVKVWKAVREVVVAVAGRGASAPWPRSGCTRRSTSSASSTSRSGCPWPRRSASSTGSAPGCTASASGAP